MVKLLKHELFALFRILAFFAGAVLIFACLGRISLEVQLKGNGADGAFTFLVIMFYVIAIFALIIGAWGLGVSRFYKTLFTGEGYMTLSLPVSPMQLIWAKVLSSIIAMASASVVSILSLVIIFAGLDPYLSEAFGSMFSWLFEMLGVLITVEPLLFIEGLLIFILSIPMSLLVIFAGISVGQLFTAHRKLMMYLVLVGVYIFVQLFTTLALAPLLASAGVVSEHLSMWIYIILIAGVDVGCFFLIRYILKNKVNLIV